jgi:hypothetical protein
VPTDEIEGPRGLLAMPRQWDDPEWSGLRRLLNAAPPGMSYATVARAWAKVRQKRNRLALARMTPGNSMAGMRATTFPWFYSHRFHLGSSTPPGPCNPRCLVSGDAMAAG